jgi:serine phosphatase RsbU (regulator of sigma subunit)
MEPNQQCPHNTNIEQDELERRDFYLRTLFDISNDIFGTMDSGTILRNFLLMTMGNFAVIEGFILIVELRSKETVNFINAGFENNELSDLQKAAQKALLGEQSTGESVKDAEFKDIGRLSPKLACAVSFGIDSDNVGMMGLGSKIISKPYTENEKKLLITLVNSMVIALQNAGAFEEIKQLNEDLLAKKKELEKTVVELRSAMQTVDRYSRHLEQIIAALNVAQQVQQSLLPQCPPKEKRFDIAGGSLYCDETGGDYYDYIKLPCLGADVYAIAIGDVSGHGISSALLMAGVRAYLRSRATQAGSVAEIITDVNRLVSADTMETSQFMTLFFLMIEAQTGRLAWVRAGHDPALLYSPDADHFEKLAGAGLPLGVDENWQYTDQTATVRPGQIVILTTDGVWETRNKEGEMFGRSRFKKIIRRKSNLASEGIRQAIIDAVTSFRGEAQQEDDITLVISKYL